METDLLSQMQKLEKLVDSRMHKYEDKLDKVTTASTSNEPDISALAKDFLEFKTFVHEALSTIKTQIQLLAISHDRHETIMRRKVLLIHGVSEKPKENTCEVVLKLLTNQLKLSDIKEEHLQVCHRLGSSQAKTRPILVRFQALEHRHLVWDSKTSLKGTGITISEFLTKMRHRVFVAARTHYGIKQCWTVEGKITIILPNKSKQKIESMHELDQLIALHPSNQPSPTSPPSSSPPSPGRDKEENIQDESSSKQNPPKTNPTGSRKARRRN